MGPLFVVSACTGCVTVVALVCVLVGPMVYPDAALKRQCGWLRNWNAFEYVVAVVLDQVTALVCLVQASVLLTYANLAMYREELTRTSRDENVFSTVAMVCGAWIVFTLILRMCGNRRASGGDRQVGRECAEPTEDQSAPLFLPHRSGARPTGVSVLPFVRIEWYREVWGVVNWDDVFVWSLVLGMQSTACSVAGSTLSRSFGTADWFTCAVIVCGILFATLLVGTVLQVICSSIVQVWAHRLACLVAHVPPATVIASADAMPRDAALFVEDMRTVVGIVIPYLRKDVIQLGTMVSVLQSCASITLLNGFNEDDLHAASNWNWGIFTLASAFPVGMLLSVGMRALDMARAVKTGKEKARWKGTDGAADTQWRK